MKGTCYISQTEQNYYCKAANNHWPQVPAAVIILQEKLYPKTQTEVKYSNS